MGGGRSYFSKPSKNLQQLIKKSKEEADKKKLSGEINSYIRGVLSGFVRDYDKINSYLEKIKDVIKDNAEINNLLFGGSVAKHTYVDGLSDVDALVVLNDSELEGKSPQNALDTLHNMLRDKLTYENIKEVTKGKMAVTIKYKDGNEIQLLPSIKTGKDYSVPNADVNKWNKTNPNTFKKLLTHANERMNGVLIPTIKLFKSIISTMPGGKELKGYHTEALCIESFKGYRGEKTWQSALVHAFGESSKKVLNPINDITGQSRVVDEYLGSANSNARKSISKSLSRISKRLESASVVNDWIKIIED